MGRTTHSGPIKSTGGFEVGAVGTNTAVVDSDGNITVPAGSSVAGARPYALKADNYTVTAAESGTIFGIATDAKTFTLPTAASGLTYTFVNTGAAGNNLVDVAAPAGVIAGTFTLAGTVVVVSAATTIRLTKGTSILGDSVTLVSDGTNWYIESSTGIWAQQAP